MRALRSDARRVLVAGSPGVRLRPRDSLRASHDCGLVEMRASRIHFAHPATAAWRQRSRNQRGEYSPAASASSQQGGGPAEPLDSSGQCVVSWECLSSEMA